MDKNLHFALLGQLMWKGVVPAFDLNAFFEEELGQEYDPMADYNYEPIPAVENYLRQYPPQETDLLKLDSLSLDGGDAIYGWIWPQWDGEDDYFSIRSFEGIEACRNITSIDIVGVLSLDHPVNLKGIDKLPQLTKLSFDGGLFGDLYPLTEAPELRSVTFFYSLFTSDTNRDAVFSALREKGVTVSS